LFFFNCQFYFYSYCITGLFLDRFISGPIRNLIQNRGFLRLKKQTAARLLISKINNKPPKEFRSY